MVGIPDVVFYTEPVARWYRRGTRHAHARTTLIALERTNHLAGKLKSHVLPRGTRGMAVVWQHGCRMPVVWLAVYQPFSREAEIVRLQH